jgi:hypothetical protein
VTFSAMRFWCHRAAGQLGLGKFQNRRCSGARIEANEGESQAGWGPSRLGFQTEGDSEGDCSVCPGTHSSFQTTVSK